jgi:multiple sugar transport system ATP-binding protein
VRDPDVFLMDEPLSNLDAKLRIQMRAELQELHAELKTTTVYVTHDQTEAMTLGDRVVVLDGGEVQQIDTPQRLYDYPENRFIASFIGSPAMNLFSVELERETGTTVARNGEMFFRLPDGEGLAEHKSESPTLGVRPEDLRVVDPEDPNPPEGFEADVLVTESLGDSLPLYVDADETELKVRVEPRSRINSGDTVTITYDPERLRLFDGQTGECIYHSSDPRVDEPVAATD